MKTLKERVLKMEPKVEHTTEQLDVSRKTVHHIILGLDVIGYHSRESWAWSQAWSWLVKNGYPPKF